MLKTIVLFKNFQHWQLYEKHVNWPAAQSTLSDSCYQEGLNTMRHILDSLLRSDL